MSSLFKKYMIEYLPKDGAYDLDRIETILLCSGKNEYLMQYGEDSMEESYGGINTCGFINSDSNADEANSDFFAEE